MGSFIEVKNFERFQHYKDRRPTWIKLYNDLLDDYEFGCLQDASKWLAVGLWLLASRTDNRIPNDPKWIARMIHASQPVDIAPLVSAGFARVVQDASKSLADRSEPASPEEETEVEEERETKGGKVVSLRAGVDPELAADQIIMAANRGMDENPAIPFVHPIHLGHGSRQNVMDWLNEGVGWETARDICYRLAKEYKPDGRRKQISSMAYFDLAVGEARDRERANNTEVGDGNRSDGRDPGSTAAVGGAKKPDKFARLTISGDDAGAAA
jgi:hypothetical protein